MYGGGKGVWWRHVWMVVACQLMGIAVRVLVLMAVLVLVLMAVLVLACDEWLCGGSTLGCGRRR